MRTAVQGAGSNDVGACAHQGRDPKVHGGLTTRSCYRTDAAFEGRHPFLQDRCRWIGNSGVDVAWTLGIEKRRRVVAVLEDEGRRLIDRHCPGAGRWVRLLTCV